jgi:hypothetical protein
VAPVDISVVGSSDSAFRWVLLHNPTVVGDAFSFSPANTYSSVEVDTARTNTTTVSGGAQIASGYAQQSALGGGAVATAVAPYDYRLGMKIDGTSDILVLAAQRIANQQVTFYGSLSWREVR